jgi:hypothetical protein
MGRSALRLRPWAHLQRSPGITLRLANPRRFIDPAASRTGLAARCCQAANPGANVTALKEVGLAMKFRQPDFFWRRKNRNN